MPVHYCLGLREEKYARAAEPGHLHPLIQKLPDAARKVSFQHLPSFRWAELGGLSSNLIARLVFPDHANAKSFQDELRCNGLRDGCGKDSDFGFGSDPVISVMDSWSPLAVGGGIFGTRDVADSLTGVAALGNATGKGVNVIIIDRGLNRDWVEGTIARMASRRGLQNAPLKPDVLGWTRYEWTGVPGQRTRRSVFPGATGSDHAHMIARNVLAIAPEANIWDAPLLPRQDEQDAPPSPSSAAHLFYLIKQAVTSGTVWSWDTRRNSLVESNIGKPVVVVNAWGVLDPESDPSFQGYADDPDHFVVNDMPALTKAGIDVVFAAGNCGESCPDRRCGRTDTGPGRSILGLNAHPDVLTVGAVRADGLPLAFSAQGPGRLARKGTHGINNYTECVHAKQKPDLCAPSHFRESDNALEVNTGTSAACGFAAGVLAALRSVPAGRLCPPEKMRDLLRRTAQRENSGWDQRLGYGIINAEHALKSLLALKA